MKKHRKIWLLDAVWEDLLNAVTEEADWHNFVKNEGKTLGKGPTLLAKCLNEVKEMREFGASAIEAIRNACLELDARKHQDLDQSFLPLCCAKHRTPTTYPRNNPTQANRPQEENMETVRGKPRVRL